MLLNLPVQCWCALHCVSVALLDLRDPLAVALDALEEALDENETCYKL